MGGERASLDRAVWIVAGGAVGVLLLVATRYGYHRDELYYLRAAGELAWGYVDQPPLTALLARIVDELFSGALFAMRLIPAMAFGGLCLATGMLAAEFGGGRRAQVLATLCTALSGQFLGASHLLSTTSFDFLAWAVVILLVSRIVRSGEQKEWVWVGFVVGIALLNKWMIAFLILGLGVGLLASGPRRVLRSRWLLVGGLVALALWLPNLMWQAQQGWPALEMTRSLANEFREEEGPFIYLLGQILYPGPLSTPVWILGVWFLTRAEELDRYGFLVVAYAFLLVLFLITGGKPYYAGAMYVVLFAAGAVAIETRFVQWMRLVFVTVAVGGIGSLIIGLPILPPSMLATIPLQEINYDLGEQIGWDTLVEQVDDLSESIPAADRSTTVFFTANYGEAGAIDHLGDETMQPAYSGHNNYWLWGPPNDRFDSVLAIGFRDRSFLERFFTGCDELGTIAMPHVIENDEAGAPVVFCAGLRAPWSEMWAELRHYG